MGTKYVGTDHEQLALSTYINLVRAAESILSRLNQRRSPEALTLRQYMVMDALYFLGPLSQKEIGIKVPGWLTKQGNINQRVVFRVEPSSRGVLAHRPIFMIGSFLNLQSLIGGTHGKHTLPL